MVVGTGLGGATLGLVLARHGKRILFVEKGRDLGLAKAAIRGHVVEADPLFGGSLEDQSEALRRGGRRVEEAEIGGLLVRPEIGSGTGGSSALHGGVLERFFPADFAAWPITYRDLAPWYAGAEELYGVKGERDPLRADAGAPLPAPIPAGAATEELLSALTERGLHPYRLPLACRAVPDCSACQGFLCARECKNDADRMALRPALALGASLATGCEAVSLDASPTRVTGVDCVQDGRRVTLRAAVVVLAAGALATPALLLASRSGGWDRGLANGSGLVGRNLMRHGIDLWALPGARLLGHPGDAKALGFNDFYETPRGKLGTVQSFGTLPALEAVLAHRSPALRLLAPFARALWPMLSRVPILASILEDLPQTSNGLEVANGRPRITYRPSPDDERRRAIFREELRPRLAGLRPVLVSGRDAPKALGHVCGTCRFGEDPESSVLDPWNRAHGLDNLYVVDGSFFPTSAGINPALTIAANALRVGEHLAERL